MAPLQEQARHFTPPWSSPASGRRVARLAQSDGLGNLGTVASVARAGSPDHSQPDWIHANNPYQECSSSSDLRSKDTLTKT